MIYLLYLNGQKFLLEQAFQQVISKIMLSDLFNKANNLYSNEDFLTDSLKLLIIIVEINK